MSTELIIQEKDLELVVSEKTLGSLTTNAIQIRNLVKRSLPMYDISYYNDDNIDQAKKDKASLNKAAKVLNDKRIEIEKEFVKPFVEFKEIVSETVKLISECSGKIDIVVKQNDQNYRNKKKESITKYFDDKNTHHIDFNKVFKIEWLNKTAKEKVVLAEIDCILSKIEDDIRTLEAMPEDVDVLRTFYFDSLNINNTIQYSNRLRESRERAKESEEAKCKVEEVAKSNPEVPRPVCPSPFVQPTPIQPMPIGIEQEQSGLMVRAFKVTTSRANIIALADFMNERGILFKKLNL